MQQVNRACERCAKRKARCDGQEPCQRCIDSSSTCEYTIARKRGPKRKSSVLHSAGLNSKITSVNHSRSGTPGSLDALLPVTLRNHLLDLCQAFVLVSWPMVYMPAQPSLSSLSESRPVLFSALLLSCTAIAPREHEDSLQTARQTLFNNFTAHFQAQGGLNCSEPNLPLIQALLYVTSYYIGAGRITVAWNHCGLACRMALSMSLHQSVRSSGRKQRSRIDEQEERRTFWGLYVMEQVVSYLLRLPPLLRAEDADRELPDVDERDEYELWLNECTLAFISPTQAKVMAGVRTHALSSLLAWVQVMKEHESIRKDLKKDLPSGTGAFERQYSARSKRLQGLRDQLPQHLQWDSPYSNAAADYGSFQDFAASFDLALDSHTSFAPQVLLMRAWYSECCILLHRPCVGEGPQGSLSARQCLCAATEVCAIVSAYERSFGIHLMQSGFIHIIFQSATLLAAMESVYQIYGPDFWSPALPAFPIAMLFDKCFAWLRMLAVRFPFANHYLSILASLSKAQAQSWQASAAQLQQRESAAVKSDALASVVETQSHGGSGGHQQGTPSASLRRAEIHLPPAHVLQPPAPAPLPPGSQPPQSVDVADGFWDIAPFDGDNLNEWLSGIESFVPM